MHHDDKLFYISEAVTSTNGSESGRENSLKYLVIYEMSLFAINPMYDKTEKKIFH